MLYLVYEEEYVCILGVQNGFGALLRLYSARQGLVCMRRLFHRYRKRKSSARMPGISPLLHILRALISPPLHILRALIARNTPSIPLGDLNKETRGIGLYNMYERDSHSRMFRIMLRGLYMLIHERAVHVSCTC